MLTRSTHLFRCNSSKSKKHPPTPSLSYQIRRQGLSTGLSLSSCLLCLGHDATIRINMLQLYVQLTSPTRLKCCWSQGSSCPNLLFEFLQENWPTNKPNSPIEFSKETNMHAKYLKSAMYFIKLKWFCIYQGAQAAANYFMCSTQCNPVLKSPRKDLLAFQTHCLYLWK